MMGERKREKEKEKDLYVREKIMREMIKIKNYLKNIDTAIVKDLNNELDVFYKEVEMVESGHKYPMFSPQKSAGGRALKKVKRHDESIVEKMENVTEACKQLLNEINKENIDVKKELDEIRNYLTDVRNEFKDRFGILKGVK